MSLPKTVQPGKPKLTEPPSGWIQSPLNDHLWEVRRPAKLADGDTYRLVTVKRARGGVVKRADMTGKEISVKTQFYLEPDDFLVSKRQIVHGACGVVPDVLAGSIVSNEYSIFKCRDTFDLDFLKYLSHSIYFQQTCFHSSIGVHVEKLIFKVDQWLNWNFNVPPLAEQKKIARILHTWDQAIEATENLIESATAQKKALMQQLLTGQKRVAGDADVFVRYRIGDLANIDVRSLGKNTSSNFEFEYISLSDVKTQMISDDLEVHLFETAPSRARRCLELGDILMSTVRPNLQAFAVVGERHKDCIASTGFAVLSMKPHFDGDYLYHYLFGSHITGQINALVVGSNYPAINSSDVSALNVYAPSLKEQTEIAGLLNNAESEIQILSVQRDSLKKQKKALMQQLLTGKRRVKIDGGA